MEQTMKRCALVSGGITLAVAILWLVLSRDFALTIAITAGTVFYHIGIRLLVGWAFDQFVDNQTDYRKKWYQVSNWENAVYKKLQVKSWKRHLPTYDSSLFDPALHSWEEIAKAMCQAELVHEVNVVLSFVPILFSVWVGALSVFVITSILAAGYDLLFVILQRYNRPRVLHLAMRKVTNMKSRSRQGH